MVHRFANALGFAAALLVSLAPAKADTPPLYSIDAHIISSGSSLRAGSACLHLTATIAEPVVGYSSSATYAMSAGFQQRAAPVVNDEIFFYGFEDCTP